MHDKVREETPGENPRRSGFPQALHVCVCVSLLRRKKQTSGSKWESQAISTRARALIEIDPLKLLPLACCCRALHPFACFRRFGYVRAKSSKEDE